MPVEYDYLPGRHLIRIICSGSVTMDERTECVHRIMVDEFLPTSAPIIIDVCQATNAPTQENLFLIVEMLKSLRERFGSRIAIINATPGHLTVSHMVSVLFNLREEVVRVVMSDEEARKWLY